MKSLLLIFVSILLIEPCSADQLNITGNKTDVISTNNLPTRKSTVVDSDGSACMGEDKSRKQTVQAALAEAKRKAVEFVSTYVSSETQVINAELEHDRISAYAHAEIKILQETENIWFKDPTYGDCYKTKIKAEIFPSVKPVETSNSKMNKKQEYAAQENCSKHAQEFFYIWNNDQKSSNNAEFTSHYNLKLHQCFVLIEYLSKEHSNYKQLFDAVARKEYGFYAHGPNDPLVCQTLKGSCKSFGEFTGFVKSYMEE